MSNNITAPEPDQSQGVGAPALSEESLTIDRLALADAIRQSVMEIFSDPRASDSKPSETTLFAVAQRVFEIVRQSPRSSGTRQAPSSSYEPLRGHVGRALGR